MPSQNGASDLSHRATWWGLVRALKSRNFLLLAGTARKTLSTRAALHARTWTEMARKAPSF